MTIYINKTLIIKLEQDDSFRFKEILKCVDKSKLKGGQNDLYLELLERV